MNILPRVCSTTFRSMFNYPGVCSITLGDMLNYPRVCSTTLGDLFNYPRVCSTTLGDLLTTLGNVQLPSGICLTTSPGQSREENPFARLLWQRPRHLMVVWSRKLEEQRGLKNHNNIKIVWFGIKTTVFVTNGSKKNDGELASTSFCVEF